MRREELVYVCGIVASTYAVSFSQEIENNNNNYYYNNRSLPFLAMLNTDSFLTGLCRHVLAYSIGSGEARRVQSLLNQTRRCPSSIGFKLDSLSPCCHLLRIDGHYSNISRLTILVATPGFPWSRTIPMHIWREGYQEDRSSFSFVGADLWLLHCLGSADLTHTCIVCRSSGVW